MDQTDKSIEVQTAMMTPEVATTPNKTVNTSPTAPPPPQTPKVTNIYELRADDLVRAPLVTKKRKKDLLKIATDGDVKFVERRARVRRALFVSQSWLDFPNFRFCI